MSRAELFDGRNREHVVRYHTCWLADLGVVVGQVTPETAIACARFSEDPPK